jgi:hypothetical protein
VCRFYGRWATLLPAYYCFEPERRTGPHVRLILAAFPAMVTGYQFLSILLETLAGSSLMDSSGLTFLNHEREIEKKKETDPQNGRHYFPIYRTATSKISDLTGRCHVY